MEKTLLTNQNNAQTAIARAHPNIAFIKYWGNRDDALRLPVNSSISMNLDGLYTQTTVRWDATLASDTLQLNHQPAAPAALQRVSDHLTMLRDHLHIDSHASVESENNFPMGAGIASSASAFAALTVAATAAAGVTLTEQELTTLARRGSGSASRSVPSGFVVWHAGDSHATSYAHSIAEPQAWPLVDVIAIINPEHKVVGSSHGHTSAHTSDLQAARLEGAEDRLQAVIAAIHAQDFLTFAEVVEHDSNLMHAVMMTSRPPLFYWMPASLIVMQAVRDWRAEGLSVCYTLDAGPNVHCICTAADAPQVTARLVALPGVLNVLRANVGAGASIIS